jgi:hypothetical protein
MPVVYIHKVTPDSYAVIGSVNAKQTAANAEIQDFALGRALPVPSKGDAIPVMRMTAKKRPKLV